MKEKRKHTHTQSNMKCTRVRARTQKHANRHTRTPTHIRTIARAHTQGIETKTHQIREMHEGENK